VGVGKEGFEWAGIATIGRKVEWPTWTPPGDMIARRPELAQYSGGMPGGPDNPLGARAMYLYAAGRDTLYRIHGTNEPQSIGQAASSGCIRMLNEEVIELYDQVPVGTKVIVL
jgi:lipoprotein-anchoring transpeptidase ErfK/SrfK